jgi:hypothetical protein
VFIHLEPSFLVSLYGRDVNSRSAISLLKEHQPAFLVTSLGETEFTSIDFSVMGRPRGGTVSEARAIEENFVHELQTGVWQWMDFPFQIWS